MNIDIISVIPALMESFNDTDESQKAMVVIALGYFGPKAKAAVPLLLQARKDKNEDVRELAKQALLKIDPETFSEKKSK